MSRLKTARAIGLLIAERISKAGMRFIEKHDPDLHFDLEQARKGRKSR